MTRRLNSLIRCFLRWADHALAVNTVKAYRHQLGKWALAVGNKPVAQLRPMHLTMWGKTWHHYQAVVRLFRWAVNEAKILKASPFDGIRFPGRGRRLRTLSPRELAQLRRRATPAARYLLMGIQQTMGRPQELRAASWEDLRTEDPAQSLVPALLCGRALIVLSDYKDRAKRSDPSAERVLLISRRLGRLIARLHGRRAEDSGRIFLNSRGRPWTMNALRCMMRRLRASLGWESDKRGEKVVAYTIRHSCATLAASRGIRDRALADILGHVETRTTARYQHLCVEHLREALQKMEKRRMAA